MDKNDPKYKEQVLNNLPLICGALRELHISYNDWRDMFQECAIGLLLAVQHYNPDLGYQFSTFAMAVMKRQVMKALAGNTIVTKNTYAKRISYTLEKQIDYYQSKGLTMDEIVEKIGYSSYSKMDTIRGYARSPILVDMSLIDHIHNDTFSHRPCKDANDNSALIRQMADILTVSPIDSSKMDYEDLYQVVTQLAMQDRRVRAFIWRAVLLLPTSDIAERLNEPLAKVRKMIIDGGKELRYSLRTYYMDYFGHEPLREVFSLLLDNSKKDARIKNYLLSVCANSTPNIEEKELVLAFLKEHGIAWDVTINLKVFLNKRHFVKKNLFSL